MSKPSYFSPTGKLCAKTKLFIRETLHRSLLLTHFHRVPDSTCSLGTHILDTDSLGYDPSFTAGVCSRSMKSEVPFGLYSSNIKVIAACRALVTKTVLWDKNGNHTEVLEAPLSLAMSTDRAKLACRGLDDTEIDLLQQCTQNLQDTAPTYVPSQLKQIYFEADGEEVLLTPVNSVKHTHELNFRLAEPLKEKLHVMTIPCGGTKPQNVGYLTTWGSVCGNMVDTDGNVGSEKQETIKGGQQNTRAYGVPGVISRVPKPNSSVESKYMRQVKASGKYPLPYLELDSLTYFGKRAAIAIPLRSHIDAENRHAHVLAEVCLEPMRCLRKVFARKDVSVWEQPGWSGVDKNVRHLLDPRTGAVDLRVAAANLAQGVRAKIHTVMGKGFELPLRSYQALESAFYEQLRNV